MNVRYAFFHSFIAYLCVHNDLEMFVGTSCTIRSIAWDFYRSETKKKNRQEETDP